VDVADLQIGQLDALLAGRDEKPPGHRLRILAVARTEDGWWNMLQRRYDTLVEIPLKVDPPPLPERQEAYREAVDAGNASRKHSMSESATTAGCGGATGHLQRTTLTSELQTLSPHPLGQLPHQQLIQTQLIQTQCAVGVLRPGGGEPAVHG